LATPLKTCSIIVEVRGDALFIDFVSEGQLFCQASCDTPTSGQDVQHWVEQVVDSSRYFAVKIQGENGREAMIGFGFRDREKAMDLRESLQHYQKSIQRDKMAAEPSRHSFSIPQLAEGEVIHVNVSGTKKTTVVKTKPATKSKGAPLLLKKPPPPPPADA
jgi:hypothetical protein